VEALTVLGFGASTFGGGWLPTVALFFIHGGWEFAGGSVALLFLAQLLRAGVLGVELFLTHGGVLLFAYFTGLVHCRWVLVVRLAYSYWQAFAFSTCFTKPLLSNQNITHYCELNSIINKIFESTLFYFHISHLKNL
jgi:hypothetical protein